MKVEGRRYCLLNSPEGHHDPIEIMRQDVETYDEALIWCDQWMSQPRKVCRCGREKMHATSYPRKPR